MLGINTKTFDDTIQSFERLEFRMLVLLNICLIILIFI